MLHRIIDANLNRFKEGIRVIEDIARYILNNGDLAMRLKDIRHRAKNTKYDLLLSRNIKDDVSKQSNISETKRANIKDVAIANFKRAQESARVLEEILKLDDTIDSGTFKQLRYELYDIEIDYFKAMDRALSK